MILAEFDADQPVFQLFAARVARFDRLDKGFVAVVVAQVAQRVAVALPIGFEDHPIRRFGAFHEAAGVEIAVAGEQLAQADFGGGFVNEARGVGGADRRRRRFAVLQTHRRRRGAIVAARQHGFLLMPGALAEYRVQPHAEEGGNHGEQDDRKSSHGQKSNAGNGNIEANT